MNPINYNFDSAEWYVVPRSFTQKAYDEQKVTEDEIHQNLQSALIQWTPSQEQIQSTFLHEFPAEIQEMIFNSMEARVLKNCLLVCKEFAKMATQFYVQNALEKEFKQEEVAIDERLNKSPQAPSADTVIWLGRKVSSGHPQYESKLKLAERQINSFNNLCCFLYNHSKIDGDITQVKKILISTMKLKKACSDMQLQILSNQQQS